MDRETIIKGLGIERECVSRDCDRDCGKCDLAQDRDWLLSVYDGALELLKEQEAVEPKTIPEELKLKMWDALYAEEDKFEKKYTGTKEHNSWFLIYRPWLQAGFDLAIKAIADWEGR